MAAIKIGCGQITWRNVPEADVLNDIAQAGYEGTPPKLTIDRTPEGTNEQYRQHGLLPAPPYFSAAFWQKEQRDQILAKARHHARFVRELGCSELYVAPTGFDQIMPSGRTRAQSAGHVSLDDALTDEEFERFANLLNEVAVVTLNEGVRGCFHNHVGTVIETGEEVDRLLSLVDADQVFLGLDTGHLAWAGADVVGYCRKYAHRIKTLHLKDIHDDVRRRGHAEGWDYRTFTQNGIFAELGEGIIDFPAIIAILKEAEFDGWLIVETDVTRKPSALESATISRNYLRSIGL